MSSTQCIDDGFELIAQLLTASECDAVAANLGQIQSDAKGTRCLLLQPWCTDLAMHIRQAASRADSFWLCGRTVHLL